MDGCLENKFYYDQDKSVIRQYHNNFHVYVLEFNFNKYVHLIMSWRKTEKMDTEYFLE